MGLPSPEGQTQDGQADRQRDPRGAAWWYSGGALCSGSVNSRVPFPPPVDLVGLADSPPARPAIHGPVATPPRDCQVRRGECDDSSAPAEVTQETEADLSYDVRMVGTVAATQADRHRGCLRQAYSVDGSSCGNIVVAATADPLELLKPFGQRGIDGTSTCRGGDLNWIQRCLQISGEGGSHSDDV